MAMICALYFNGIPRHHPLQMYLILVTLFAILYKRDAPRGNQVRKGQRGYAYKGYSFQSSGNSQQSTQSTQQTTQSTAQPPLNICGSKSGIASFYDVNNPSENNGYTGQVSCPIAIPSNGMYAALPVQCMQNQCGKVLTITYNGKSITVPVIDECNGCASNQVDLSVSAWRALESNTNIGILSVEFK
eukprot:NODE_376_length_8513_cov_1.020086.p6 type:complete len:187 gc:universal NODE_376_length_8513_cov_1.020086:2204-2764(+)